MVWNMKGIRAETHQKEFPPGRGFYPSLSTSNHYHNTKPLVHLPGGPIGKLVMHRRNRKSVAYLVKMSSFSTWVLRGRATACHWIGDWTLFIAYRVERQIWFSGTDWSVDQNDQKMIRNDQNTRTFCSIWSETDQRRIREWSEIKCKWSELIRDWSETDQKWPDSIDQ